MYSVTIVIIGWKEMTMATKTVSIRMDDELYRKFKEFCDELYLPPSALIAAFAATTVREQRVPFEFSADPFYANENKAKIIQAIEQLERGEGTAHELIEV